MWANPHEHKHKHKRTDQDGVTKRSKIKLKPKQNKMALSTHSVCEREGSNGCVFEA